ncbi:FAD-dependent oxidoreductase [Halostagnicola sp. A-GB9-2]|uniref:FAD-dependent oxidoreductase n=1 Tax=Halostagnicola sp. A-GB9-2 TaxID=3048066 RepID=UPI0024C0889F|nr:FAD-dependent oxidoreductase [Halostagnicola sp. A-GB9-2]MDJ1434372.1 FAD-dependent oxidoreductase [Halostagnicola sp. A-GB9-2]
MTEDIQTDTVSKSEQDERTHIEADICVLGAGISGVSTALEAAKSGADVVLADASQSIGGQAVGSIIGTLIGLYSHGDDPYQLTHGIADDLIEDLEPEGSIQRLSAQTSELSTVLFQYDEVELQRWMERKCQQHGVRTLLAAILTDVEFTDRRVDHLDFTTRYGSVRVEADGFVDASGDGSLCWEAGLELREPNEPVYGSLNFLIEGYDTDTVGDFSMDDVHDRLEEVGEEYGLVREDGHLMHFPEKDFMLANITHIETPLDPLGYGNMVFEGRRQADKTVEFLQTEFSEIFDGASVRRYGNPGIRQTRWIKSREQLTLDDLREGYRPDDAVARGSWSVELHDTPEDVHWEHFEDGHVYYIPLSCMIPEGADNIVTVGRCVDADTEALSAIRIMGICIAMGAAAAHSLDLAGSDPVYEIDMDDLQERLDENLERTD